MTAVRVIKLGGSLLGWPELTERFRSWLAAQPPAANVVIVGGGPVVESIRQLDRDCPLADEAAHWLAIRAMGITAALVAQQFDSARLVTSLESLQLAESPNLQVLDVERFLREDHGTPSALPCGWHVTSDSIAARVATVLRASELVLLKSTLPSGATREAWSRNAFVDPYFPRASQTLHVRAINLRALSSSVLPPASRLQPLA
jgi:aspartokinase-like uncharacterized kinase